MPLAADKLRLIVTGKCNLACFYCHNEGQAKEDTFVRLDALRRIAETITATHRRVSEVTISGGEPFLHPQLNDIIELAGGLCDRVTVVSNGVLASPERIQALAERGLRKLRLGVDSLDETKPRPSPGRLSRPFAVSSLLAAARSAGLGMDLNVVLTRFNRGQIEALVRFAVDHGTSIKFFEHVVVRSFGAEGAGGSMVAMPRVPFEDFAERVRAALGDDVAFAPADRFGEANLRHLAGSVEIRYCRYLCNYRLCWLTGTRIDPQGYVYNCMSNRGLDRIDTAATSAAISRTIEDASTRPCRAGVAQPIRA
jgi:molybdenum cofactor biosynthesis enzyme MoaA